MSASVSHSRNPFHKKKIQMVPSFTRSNLGSCFERLRMVRSIREMVYTVLGTCAVSVFGNDNHCLREVSESLYTEFHVCVHPCTISSNSPKQCTWTPVTNHITVLPNDST